MSFLRSSIQLFYPTALLQTKLSIRSLPLRTCSIAGVSIPHLFPSNASYRTGTPRFLATSTSLSFPNDTHANMSDAPTSFYEFTAKDIDGNEVSMDQYRGNVVLIVNVACKCGLTKGNYTQLVELDERYRERGLRILAFPSNQFAGQEPGSNEEIKAFVADFGVKFDMFDKIDVNGPNAHPLFAFLKKEKSGFLVSAIKWNFSKFLLDRKGNVVKRYGPKEEPASFTKEIEKLLDESA